MKPKNLQQFSRFTDKGPSKAERVIRTIRILFKEPVFEKGKADWISELPSVIKKYNNTIHNSTKMNPNQASKKSNEKLVYSNLQDRRGRQQPKFNLVQLVRTADIKRVFSKGDSTNWSQNVDKISEVIHVTIPSKRIDYLPERYNENLIRSTNLTHEKNDQVMKELN